MQAFSCSGCVRLRLRDVVCSCMHDRSSHRGLGVASRLTFNPPFLIAVMFCWYKNACRRLARESTWSEYSSGMKAIDNSNDDRADFITPPVIKQYMTRTSGYNSMTQNSGRTFHECAWTSTDIATRTSSHTSQHCPVTPLTELYYTVLATDRILAHWKALNKHTAVFCTLDGSTAFPSQDQSSIRWDDIHGNAYESTLWILSSMCCFLKLFQWAGVSAAVQSCNNSSCLKQLHPGSLCTLLYTCTLLYMWTCVSISNHT